MSFLTASFARSTYSSARFAHWVSCSKSFRVVPILLQKSFTSKLFCEGWGSHTKISGVTCLEFASRIGFDRKVSCLTYFYLTRFPTSKSEFQNRFVTRSRYSHTPLETAVIVNRERINNVLRSTYVGCLLESQYYHQPIR